ncbi:disintegrin and metalloproteinase domain-containing protein 10-like [Ruditapes philippinarum]|uniref:disintegrin and metalloproteinase domain-containing protein 10-like n=1 Tax=Ruditapes philippinarum TaxID=129788 RepID=UPI00295A7907|nr:disintegrin and metalloproteinase domain-containing protein 10-like [Ruditapes philippinarum]
MSNDNDKLTIQEKEDLCYIGCRRKKSHECISSHDRSKVKQHLEFMNLLSNISSDNTILPVQGPTAFGEFPGNTLFLDKFFMNAVIKRGTLWGFLKRSDTPLARLRQCFASGECAERILYILRVYWWAVILCSIAGLVLFCLFVKCCAVHTKSSNPEVELRHPHRSVRQSVTSVRDSVVHPQKTFRASVRSVRGSLRSVSGTMRNARDSFRRMNSRPVTSEFDLKKIEEELEVLNKNPSTNVDDVFL